MRPSSIANPAFVLSALIIAPLSVISGAGTSAAESAEKGSATLPVCERTADKLRSACLLDTHEELHLTSANCLNLTGPARTACHEQAGETFEEERELCHEQREARLDVCALLGENRYHPDPLLNPAIQFIDPDDIPAVHAPNPYVSLQSGRTLVLRGGEEFEELVVIHVTDESREIQGVSCRVVADVELTTEEESGGEIDYEAEEVTDDWFAQDIDGNVYYCGEASRSFEDEVIESVDGSFEAGKDFAKAGVLIRAAPVVGQAHRQEFAPGEAEDVLRYLKLSAVPTAAEGGENPSFACAPQGCLRVRELNPLEPGVAEIKYYKAGVGFILAVPLEEGKPTGEREELVCAGDSLEILKDPACGIEDPEELLDELCELSPDAFCVDED